MRVAGCRLINFGAVAIFFEVQRLVFARDVAIIGKVVDRSADVGIDRDTVTSSQPWPGSIDPIACEAS